MKLQTTKEEAFEVSVYTGGIFSDSASRLTELLRTTHGIVIATPTPDRLYGPQFRQTLSVHNLDFKYEVMTLRETTKTLASVEGIISLSARYKLGRDALLIAFGGGVCSDIVGLAASLIRRGIRYARIPTTLIGQIDAGIGLKTAANFVRLKNYIGGYYAPAAVLIDCSFLRSLDAEQLRHGLAEIVKVAVVADCQLLETVTEYGTELIQSGFQRPTAHAHYIIQQSIRLMHAQLEKNPYENKSYERLVDFGHTFSPSIESTSNYRIAHGDAVAVDMALTILIGEEIGITDPNAGRVFFRCMDRLHLPLWTSSLSRDLCRSAFADATRHRGGSLNLVIPESVGSAKFLKSGNDVSNQVLDRALQRLGEMSFGRTV